MTFLEFEERVKQYLRIVSEGVEPEVGEPPREEYGDLSSNLAFKLATLRGEKPGDVAEELVEKLRGMIVGDTLVKSVENVGGFINFRVDVRRLISSTLASVFFMGDRYGSSDLGRGKKVLVEHTNVNPNKAIHIGHARNSCLGDTLVRLFRFTGHRVYALNYVDDTGSQIADVIVGFRYLGIPMEPPKGVKFDKYCGDYVYTKVNRLYDEKPELLRYRAEVLRLIEEGGNEVAELTRRVADRVLKEQLKTCWRMGIYFDLMNWESDIIRSGLWDKAFRLMKSKGLVKYVESGEYKGCWIISLRDIPRFAEESDKVLVRSDGTLTYIAKDIAYAMWKVGVISEDFRYTKYLEEQPDGRPVWTTTSGEGEGGHPDFGGADLAISVIDVRQSRLQEIIKIVLERVAGPEYSRRYVHYGYEVVALTPSAAMELGVPKSLIGRARVVHMSGRKGIYFNVDDVLDKLRERAYLETAKRNPGADEAWLRRVSEAVAVAALRYQLLRADRNKVVVFDLKKALDLEENTGPYLLYTYVRTRGILRNAPRLPDPGRVDPEVYSGDEVGIIKMVSKFPVVVRDAALKVDPQQLAKYTFKLATEFNRFYEKYPVLKAEEAVRDARVALVYAVSQTLRNALRLMGITPLERM